MGFVQRETATEIGICVETIRDWEHGRKAPRKRYGPTIRVFLGSSPLPSGDCLPDRLRFIRWTLGADTGRSREAPSSEWMHGVGLGGRSRLAESCEPSSDRGNDDGGSRR